MIARNPGVQIDELAQRLFETITHICLSLPRPRRRANDLKEVEFLTLSILQEHQPMIVGDIQRILGVLPAQMSRIIRALENRDRPLISCRINALDKRKIDVGLTAGGEKALNEYLQVRVGVIAELLTKLPADDLNPTCLS